MTIFDHQLDYISHCIEAQRMLLFRVTKAKTDGVKRFDTPVHCLVPCSTYRKQPIWLLKIWGYVASAIVLIPFISNYSLTK